MAWTKFLDASGSTQELGAVAAAGDVDGDGLADILVTCFACGEVGHGQVFLFAGSSLSMAGATTSSESADLTISSTSPRAVGIAASGAADIDGDGLSDWGSASIGSDSVDGVFVYASVEQYCLTMDLVEDTDGAGTSDVCSGPERLIDGSVDLDPRLIPSEDALGMTGE